MRDWFRLFLPPRPDRVPPLVLDGDLPKREWFTEERAPRLSAADGAPHTVVPGRPIGLHAATVGELAALGVHLHFYGDFTQGQWRDWIARARDLAGDYLHLHPNVDQAGWTREFSRYDAGWLHFLPSENRGDLRRATWDDLNYPARIATLAAAGLPLIQYDNAGATFASQALAREHDIGLFATDMAGVAAQLRDGERLEQLRANAWRQREHFTFDHHADRLIAFFREVIASQRTDGPG
jgi:glycosyltransferase involved in cell wall biosynthesis